MEINGLPVFETFLGPFFITLLFANIVLFIVLVMLLRKSARRPGFAFNWCMRVVFDQIRPDVFNENCRRYALTKTEIEVSRLLCRGLANKDIGDKLFVSAETVKKHVHNIFQKTGMNNRIGLVFMLKQIS